MTRIEIKVSAMSDNLIHFYLPFCSTYKDAIRPLFVIEATAKNHAFEESHILVDLVQSSHVTRVRLGNSQNQIMNKGQVKQRKSTLQPHSALTFSKWFQVQGMNCLFSRTFSYMGKLQVSISLGLFLLFFCKAPVNLRVLISKLCRCTLAPMQVRNLLLFINNQKICLSQSIQPRRVQDARKSEAHFIPWILRYFSSDGPPSPSVRTCHKELKAISHCVLWLPKAH